MYTDQPLTCLSWSSAYHISRRSADGALSQSQNRVLLLFFNIFYKMFFTNFSLNLNYFKGGKTRVSLRSYIWDEVLVQDAFSVHIVWHRTYRKDSVFVHLRRGMRCKFDRWLLDQNAPHSTVSACALGICGKVCDNSICMKVVSRGHCPSPFLTLRPKKTPTVSVLCLLHLDVCKSTKCL